MANCSPRIASPDAEQARLAAADRGGGGHHEEIGNLAEAGGSGSEPKMTGSPTSSLNSRARLRATARSCPWRDAGLRFRSAKSEREGGANNC
jgi:hypothetical protein